ncbi:MAG: hypothetical protein ACLFPX_08425 [Candidatus Omnitrophota bacterium]
MSRSYYYFAATLPMLRFDSEPPVSLDDFLADCARLLTPDDHADVLRALGRLEGEGGHSLLRQWQAYDRAFRNELAWQRAGQKGENPQNVIRGEHVFDQQITAGVHHAARLDNLLEAEAYLLRARWQHLEELLGNHQFDLEFILVYAVQLKILHRLAAFRSEEGGRILDGIMREAAQQSIVQE